MLLPPPPNTQCPTAHLSRSLLNYHFSDAFPDYFLKFSVYLFMTALCPHCCTWAFSNCGTQGATLHWVFLSSVASPVVHGLLECGLW